MPPVVYQSSIPSVDPSILRDIVHGSPQARAMATTKLYRTYGAKVSRAVERRMNKRFASHADDAMADAWLRILTELSTNGGAYLAGRDDRKKSSEMIEQTLKRSVWRLEQFLRRRWLPMLEFRPDAQQGGQRGVAEANTPLTFAELLDDARSAWEHLRISRNDTDRSVLDTIGMEAFFQIDWHADLDLADEAERSTDSEIRDCALSCRQQLRRLLASQLRRRKLSDAEIKQVQRSILP